MTAPQDAAMSNGHSPDATVHDLPTSRPTTSHERMFHHELPPVMPTTEISHGSLTQTTASPEFDRRSSFASIPFYQPPAPVFTSPEMTRAVPYSMGAASSPGKKNRVESFSSMFASPSKERRESRGASQALEEEGEDARFARLLQQDDRGLRRRMS
jgi:hypothetical protein